MMGVRGTIRRAFREENGQRPMGRSVLHIAAYLLAGGLLLAWADPPAGWVRFLAIVVYIVAAAYFDALVIGAWTRARPTGRGVGREALTRRGMRSKVVPGREQRRLRPVFQSPQVEQAERLVRRLRSEGLNPILVAHTETEGKAGRWYEVILTETEQKRAQALLASMPEGRGDSPS